MSTSLPTPRRTFHQIRKCSEDLKVTAENTVLLAVSKRVTETRLPLSVVFSASHRAARYYRLPTIDGIDYLVSSIILLTIDDRQQKSTPRNVTLNDTFLESYRASSVIEGILVGA